jgi:hypothetical protein
MQLAQAGIYKGADNIEEYVKFAYAGYSPYLSMMKVNAPQVRFLRYKNGQCEFLSLYKTSLLLDPVNTNAPPRFEYVNMVKLFYKLKSRYIPRIHVFFPNGFLRLFFDVALNADPTRRYICEEVIAGPCSSYLNSSIDTTNSTVCESTLQALPTAEGTMYHIDGNSQGCRALHATFAVTNPIQHCAHVSFTPLQDPNGSIKCQNSTFTPPSSLFEESELEAFRTFARQNDIDPDIGHNCCADE